MRVQDVYSEVKLLLNTMGVDKFRSKPVGRKYCFDRERQLRDLDGTELDTSSLVDPGQVEKHP